MGTTSAWGALSRGFTQRSGHKVTVTQESSATFDQLLASDAPGDLVVLYGESLQEMIRRGKLLPGSGRIFTRAAVGLSVRSGAPWPDIATPEAFKRTLLGAESVCFSYGGSGIVAMRAIEKLGIAEEMQSTIVRSAGGPAAGYVARGEAEMAIQQINVSKPVAGTDYVGDLPGDLHEYVVFTIAIFASSKQTEAAKALIDFVTSPEAAPLLRQGLLEPAS